VHDALEVTRQWLWSAKRPKHARMLAGTALVERRSLRHWGASGGRSSPSNSSRALELEPANLKALALAGTAAFARKDYAAAATPCVRMLPLVAAGSEDVRSTQASVNQAKSLMGKREFKAVVSLSAKESKSGAGRHDLNLRACCRGPAEPLAFSLDGSMAMAPGMRLSGFPRVIGAARLS
jgi:hypothetical protein